MGGWGVDGRQLKDLDAAAPVKWMQEWDVEAAVDSKPWRSSSHVKAVFIKLR